MENEKSERLKSRRLVSFFILFFFPHPALISSNH